MIIFKKSIIFVTLFFATVSYSQNRTCSLKIINSNGREVLAKVEIAETEAARAAGLMFRRILDENEGMFFTFPDNAKRSFWMKNTYIPLSIAYIGENMIINEIYDMKPLDTSIIYNSKKPAKFALEMKQGWFKKNSITVGSKIEIVK